MHTPFPPQLDFLPAGYLAARVNRRAGYGQILVATVCAVVLTFIGVCQARRVQTLEHEVARIDDIVPRYNDLRSEVELLSLRLKESTLKARLRDRLTISTVPVELVNTLFAAASDTLFIERLHSATDPVAVNHESPVRGTPALAAAATTRPSRREVDTVAERCRNLTDDTNRLNRELTQSTPRLELTSLVATERDLSRWLRTLANLPAVENVELLHMENVPGNRALRHRCVIALTLARPLMDAETRAITSAPVSGPTTAVSGPATTAVTEAPRAEKGR
jgi:hypothetical protein